MPTGKTTAVLLLGVEETPALPIIWSLTSHAVPVTVGSHRKFCVGKMSRYPHKRLTYPDPRKHGRNFVDWVLSTVRTERYGVTLGCGEQVTYLLAKHKRELAPYTSIPIVDIETFMLCRDKSLTMKAANDCGVPIPATWYPEDAGIETIAPTLSYPVVLKPCVSNGARGIRYAASPDELVRAYAVVREEYGPCIVQEFIPRGGLQYKAELLLDEQQQVKLAGTYAKLRYYPPSGGSSTLNQTVKREDILDSARRFLTHIKWSGMGDCDFIVDPRDGVAKLMEVNPRFTRTIRVLVHAGQDYPFALYQLALGESLPEAHDFEENVFLRYLPADLAWFLKSRERFRAKPSFFRFFSRRLYYEEWSLHDPLTGFGFWLSLLLDMLDAPARRRRMR